MYYDIILCSDSTDECYIYVLFSLSKRNERKLVRVKVYESAEASETCVLYVHVPRRRAGQYLSNYVCFGRP